jgi:hypothetical protein
MNAPFDRRTSTTGLSVAVREVRIRNAREGMWRALAPVSHHVQAAILCLEIDDDDGCEHHFRHAYDAFRQAAHKRLELRGLLSSPPVSAVPGEVGGTVKALPPAVGKGGAG